MDNKHPLVDTMEVCRQLYTIRLTTHDTQPVLWLQVSPKTLAVGQRCEQWRAEEMSEEIRAERGGPSFCADFTENKQSSLQ